MSLNISKKLSILVCFSIFVSINYINFTLFRILKSLIVRIKYQYTIILVLIFGLITYFLIIINNKIWVTACNKLTDAAAPGASIPLHLRK